MVKWPFSLSTVSSDFGDTKNRPSAHSGVDFAVAAGTPIRAGGPGVVHFTGKLNDRAGNVVSIRYDAFKGTCMHTHVQARYPIPKGRRVNEGDIIAYVGSSGSASGPHLHLEVFADGPRLVNPHSVYKGVVPAGGGGNVILLPTQRRVVSHASANGRARPSTKAPVGDTLKPRTVGNFNAWARGEKVEGNDVWFRGISGRWFWSGGFEGGANTAGLSEVAAPAEPNPPVEPPSSVPSPVEPPVDPEPVEPPSVPSPVEPPEQPTDPVEPPVTPEKPSRGRVIAGSGVAVITVIVAAILSQCGGPAL